MYWPEVLEILSQKWTVKRRTDTDENDGVCLPKKHELWLDRTVHPEEIGETFLHELLHAIFHSSALSHVLFDGDEEQQEAFITLLSPQLFAVLAKNQIYFGHEDTNPAGVRARKQREVKELAISKEAVKEEAK
jgi:hypothetical protein